MGDSDMSPKARVTYDQHKFQVEFNVSEYLPEVRQICNYIFRRKLCKSPETTCKKYDGLFYKYSLMTS